jgi:hypothetical protein
MSTGRQDPHHEDGRPARVQPRPASHVFVVTNQQNTQHFFYASTTAQMIELWWQA